MRENAQKALAPISLKILTLRSYHLCALYYLQLFMFDNIRSD